MYVITSAVPWMENYATVTEKFFIGVTMTLLGVSIVVLVLALISLFVSFLSRLINRGGPSADPVKTTPGSAAANPAQAAVMQAQEMNALSEQPAVLEDRQVLAAVIAAAIAAFSAESAPRSSAGFIIRRVRRV